jgi:hypothetical protein
MVTQIIFGELYRIIESSGKWAKVRLTYDDYEGWISLNQVREIPESEFLRLFNAEPAVSMELVQILSNETTHTVLPLVMGSSLPGLKAQRIQVNKDEFLFEGLAVANPVSDLASGPHNHANVRLQLVEDAMIYLNAPYLWGGRSPFGIDCSGFVQMAYKLKNVKLQRDASRQAMQGEVVGLLAEAEPGDLVFFDDDEGSINHVGMLIDRHRIIHCSGKVRVDTIDHQGIYNEELQQYTHKLRLIKRII